MAHFAFVQEAFNTSATASVAKAYTSSPTAGSLLVACVYSNRPLGSNAISGWTLAVDKENASHAISVSIFYTIAPGGAVTVTATSASATVMQLHIYEYSGSLHSAAPVPMTAVATGTTVATLPFSGLNTNDADDLLIGVISGTASAGGGHTWSPGTIRNANATSLMLSGEYLPAAALSSATVTGGWTTPRTVIGALAAFRAPAANPAAFVGVI